MAGQKYNQAYFQAHVSLISVLSALLPCTGMAAKAAAEVRALRR